MITEHQRLAVVHFRRHQHKTPHSVLNIAGPWAGLSPEDKEADILTADWVPNRAQWRDQGFKNYAHAASVLG